MRVGLFTYRVVDRTTGLANYARSLSYGLRDLNQGVEVILLNPHPESTLAWYQDFASYPLRSPREPPAAALPLAALHLPFAARKLGLDVLHAPGNVAPFIWGGGPVAKVVTVHDVAPLALPAEHRLVARAGYGLGIPPLRWTADAVITDSQASAADLKRYARVPDSILRVVPIGTDAISDQDLLSWRSGARQVASKIGVGFPYFLAVGDLRPRKNLARVVEAFRLVLQQRPDAYLVIAGQAMHRAGAIADAARSLQHLAVPGYVAPSDLDALYAGAAALVFPSLHEGFGLPPLEAMARGTPVVTSNVSAMPEVAGDAAILVDPKSVGAIADAMLAIISDSSLAQRLGTAGRERAARFTWARTAGATLEIYREAIERRRQG